MLRCTTLISLQERVGEFLGDTWEEADLQFAIDKIRGDGYELGDDLEAFLADKPNDFLLADGVA